MKTACVMDSVSRANGGIFEADLKLQRALHAQGTGNIQVLGLRDEHTDADHAAWAPLDPVTLPVVGPSGFGYAPGFFQAIMKTDADLIYSVGLWKYPSLAVLRWAERTRRPYLVAPHGMLDPWALRNSGAKKKIAAWCFQNTQLRRASCLRALCAGEAESMRAYGLINPIAIIPNGIDLPDPTATASPRPAFLPRDQKVLLYLGRLHPKKGLVPLLAAWKSVAAQRKDWLLAIAGWDQSGHEAELKRQAADLGVADSILFLGPRFGAEKEACYRACDAFILPSFSEGLPMVVLEAWAHAKPVLMTPACNLPEGFAHQAALSVDPTPASIALGLRHLFGLSDAGLQSMGACGRALAQERFVWPKVAADMASVYRWILATGPRPDCVQEI